MQGDVMTLSAGRDGGVAEEGWDRPASSLLISPRLSLMDKDRVKLNSKHHHTTVTTHIMPTVFKGSTCLFLELTFPTVYFDGVA